MIRLLLFSRSHATGNNVPPRYRQLPGGQRMMIEKRADTLHSAVVLPETDNLPICPCTLGVGYTHDGRTQDVGLHNPSTPVQGPQKSSAKSRQSHSYIIFLKHCSHMTDSSQLRHLYLDLNPQQVGEHVGQPNAGQLVHKCPKALVSVFLPIS